MLEDLRQCLLGVRAETLCPGKALEIVWAGDALLVRKLPRIDRSLVVGMVTVNKAARDRPESPDGRPRHHNDNRLLRLRHLYDAGRVDELSLFHAWALTYGNILTSVHVEDMAIWPACTSEG